MSTKDTTSRPRTLGELRASDWRSRSVRTELRENLMLRLTEGLPVFEGIIGFDETVVPQLQAALLSEHSVLLLGLRGQAKTRLIRGLPSLLDEWQPYVEGSPLAEDPFAPILPGTRTRVAELGAATPIAWRHRDERFQEKLATPDVTVADLIGDLDPIRASRLGLDLSDPEVIHYGLVPRANRGLFAVNELPDLAARIQVALLNVLEEGDIQLRGFPLRLPLDLGLFFTANPEDYTNRGSIITPLRDRIASQILTHYPRGREEAAAITDGSARIERRTSVTLEVPDFVRDIVEQVAFEARRSDLVDQTSGVSARLPIALYEAVVSAAERRALLTGEKLAVARVGDVLASGAAVNGKLELVYDGEREGLRGVADRVLGAAVKTVFDECLPDAYSGEGEDAPYHTLLAWFTAGGEIELSDALSSVELAQRLEQIPGLRVLVEERMHLPEIDGHRAAAMEFVLEGLAQSSLLARQDAAGSRSYKDMLGEMARGL